MRSIHKPNAFTLIEMIIAMAISSMLVFAVCALLLGGSNAYHQVYASIHDPINEDSFALTAAFKAMGRKANRTNYKVYKIENGFYSEAQPEAGQSLAIGQAVEFRYWQQPFYETVPQTATMDISDTGTEYVLFYLEGDEICADYGRVINGIGAVDGGVRRTNGIVTHRLAPNLDLQKSADPFSHEVVGGVGNGCVNLNVTLENSLGQKVEVKTGTLLRISWPR